MTMDDRLDPDLIRANLKTKRIGRKVLVYDRTSSTNDIAAEYARNPDNDGLVVFAEEQTAGRGRTGATWQGGRQESLLFSVALVDCDVSSELLSLTCAVAVAEAIGQIGGCQAGIKWPNDIILDGKKVAGILLESKNQRTDDRGQRTAPHSGLQPPASSLHIIGIGINCHQTPESFPPDLQATATSLDLVSGTRCQRVTVAKRVLTSLDHWLRVAERNGQAGDRHLEPPEHAVGPARHPLLQQAPLHRQLHRRGPGKGPDPPARPRRRPHLRRRPHPHREVAWASCP